MKVRGVKLPRTMEWENRKVLLNITSSKLHSTHTYFMASKSVKFTCPKSLGYKVRLPLKVSCFLEKRLYKTELAFVLNFRCLWSWQLGSQRRSIKITLRIFILVSKRKPPTRVCDCLHNCTALPAILLLWRLPEPLQLRQPFLVIRDLNN